MTKCVGSVVGVLVGFSSNPNLTLTPFLSFWRCGLLLSVIRTHYTISRNATIVWVTFYFGTENSLCSPSSEWVSECRASEYSESLQSLPLRPPDYGTYLYPFYARKIYTGFKVEEFTHGREEVTALARSSAVKRVPTLDDNSEPAPGDGNTK